MILTHYFPNICHISNRELFTPITEYSVQEQQMIARRLSVKSGRALHRFNQFDVYMQKRIQTECWLCHAFQEVRGEPALSFPFYFILGQNQQLEHDFGPGSRKLVLDTMQINTRDISFTLGDSVGLYFSSALKKIYTLEEIESIAKNTTFIQEQMAPLEQYHRYIEAQLWNKHYLSKAQIIEYYPPS